MKDTFKMPGGDFHIKVYKNKEDYGAGVVSGYQTVHNKMTNASLAVISGLVGNTGSQSAFGYIELGTDATAAAASQTALVAAITDTGLQRSASTNSRTTTTQTNDTLNLTVTFTATGAKTIAEVGVFNAASTGVMLCRAVLGSTITTVSGNLVEILYTIKFVGN